MSLMWERTSIDSCSREDVSSELGMKAPTVPFSQSQMQKMILAEVRRLDVNGIISDSGSPHVVKKPSRIQIPILTRTQEERVP